MHFILVVVGERYSQHFQDWGLNVKTLRTFDDARVRILTERLPCASESQRRIFAIYPTLFGPASVFRLMILPALPFNWIGCRCTMRRVSTPVAEVLWTYTWAEHRRGVVIRASDFRLRLS